MNDICIPLPRIEANAAEVEVRVEGKPRKFNFRVESFPWDVPEDVSSRSGTDLRFQRFKSMIEGYDKHWELIQIYNPRPNAKTIQVLFRQRAR